MKTTIQKEINKHPVSMYINSLPSQHSKNTMALALRRAVSFMPQVDKNGDQIFFVFDYRWGEVDRSTVLGLLAAMGKKDYKPATISLSLTAVKMVMGECFDAENWGVSGDALKRIERVKAPRGNNGSSVGKLIAVGDKNKLKAAIEKDHTAAGVRDLAIITWMWLMAPRVGEVCKANLEDWKPKNGLLVIPNGKGGSSRDTVLKNGAHAIMEDWIRTRGHWKGPLFVQCDKYGQIIKSDKHLVTNTITRMIEKRCKEAGIERISPHNFRRTAITRIIDKYGIVIAQKIAGHKSILTTKQYDLSDNKKALDLAGEMEF